MFEASSAWAAGRVAGEHARHYLRCRETGTDHPPTSWKHLLMHLSFQLLITQQDRTLTDISGTVGLLREQAKVMGREVFDQNV